MIHRLDVSTPVVGEEKPTVLAVLLEEIAVRH
jgi:hypothetical protein